jgi:hypothetical protein
LAAHHRLTFDVSGFHNSIGALTVGANGTLNLGYRNVLTTSTAMFTGTLNLSTGTISDTLPEPLINYSSYTGGFTWH